jgi:hypothetical protein
VVLSTLTPSRHDLRNLDALVAAASARTPHPLGPAARVR